MKNKTKKIFKIISVVLLVILLQTMGYTYAKYVTQETGTGQADVAKWAFQIQKEGEQTKTVKLLDTTNKKTLVNGKIAPGTAGIINIVLDGTGSEVDLEYKLEFANEQNKPQNMLFSYDGKNYSSLSEIKTITGNIKQSETTKTAEIIIYWRWNYETGTTDSEISTNDQIDTQDAKVITEYTFDIIATGTQCE